MYMRERIPFLCRLSSEGKGRAELTAVTTTAVAEAHNTGTYNNIPAILLKGN